MLGKGWREGAVVVREGMKGGVSGRVTRAEVRVSNVCPVYSH